MIIILTQLLLVPSVARPIEEKSGVETDTLASFKVMKGMSQPAKLTQLADKYASWVDHVAHDADSDANALGFVTMVVFPNARRICATFGIISADFMDRTGLNMHVPSPMTMMVHMNSPSSAMKIQYEIEDADTSRDSNTSRSTI